MTTQDLNRVGIYEIDVAIKERLTFGHPYSNRALESKRRSAILWLRYCSARGWCLDGRQAAMNQFDEEDEK